VAVKEGFADGILYQEDKPQVADVAAFSRLAIVNSANRSMQDIMKIVSKQKQQDEKERLLLELDLI